MNKNITSNSGPLQRPLFTLILGIAVAATLWALPGTARGRIFVTNDQGGSNDAIRKHTNSGTLGKDSDAANALWKEKQEIEAEIAKLEAHKPDPADKAACAAWDAEAERLARRCASVIARWIALTQTRP
jgi:hypothetical protein